MPFSRPTLSAQRQQIAADISAGLSGTDALLRYSNLGILGDALAGLNNGLYGYLDWIARMAVPFTAEGEFLEAWAAYKGVVRKPATKAAGEVTFTGIDGSVVPAGYLVQRSDGVAFQTLADATIAGGSANADVVATGAGATGDTAAGSTLTMTSAVSGVSPTVKTLSGLAGAADVEADASFRSRMLKAYAEPAQGGAASDYERWALAAPGVTRAWCAGTAMGAGTVSVYVMLDTVRAAQAGFPQGTNGVADAEPRDVSATGDQLVVADAIYPLRPVTALVYVVAPGRNQLNFTIAGLAGASAATRALVSAAIATVLLAAGEPGGTVPLSLIELAIAGIPAATGFVVTAIAADHGIVTPGAAGNIVSSTGYLPVLAGIVFA